MSNRWWILGLVLAAAGCSHKAPDVIPVPPPTAKVATPPLDPMSLSEEVLGRAKNATVLIGNFEGGELTSSGSGVVSQDGLTILTDRHVVMGTDDVVDPLKIVFFSGTDHPKLVEVAADSVTVFEGNVAMDDHYYEKDVALIHLREKVADPLELGQSEKGKETQPVWSIGFPHGTRIRMDTQELPSPTVHSLRIERLEEVSGTVRVLQLGGSPTHGDSGGPVIDAAGRIIGLMQAKDEDSSIVYAVPTGTIQKLIDLGNASNKVASQWSKPLEGSKKPPEEDEEDPPSESQVSKHLLTLADLEPMDAKALTILRNEPFARHGFIFKRKDLNDVFQAFPWYTPKTTNAAAVQASFTKIERANVDLIRSYQESSGKKW